ncbi:MAG: asparagine synthase (glutamine-hydrolyzing) [Opitutales bacterium]|nr:asparagine synthase (glutamine-hydrolyzing) [Opitutales bacterium]
MCGIAGSFSIDRERHLDRSRLEQALTRLRPRGPDGQGRHCAAGIQLGHRRLAILDPDNAPQPWLETDRGEVLSYNGEIYNFRSLHKDQLNGCKLASSGDTAVLSALLAQQGLGALPKLSGMFAFAWYQPGQHRITLVRDPLGVKPLYYCFREGILNFASTVPALLDLAHWPRKLDGVALQHYLTTGRNHLDGRTLIQGIHCLRPGEVLQLDAAGKVLRSHRYWQTPIVTEGEKRTLTWESATQVCHEKILTSVKAQMVSDVPIGAFISGGLDSAIIANSIPKAERSRLFGFNVGYEHEGFNEWPWVRDLADNSGIDTSIISLGGSDAWSDLAAQIEWKGLPLSTPNEMAIRKLANAFAQRGKVALTGEGADEIFGGYALPQAGALDYDRALNLDTSAPLHARLASAYGQSRFRSRADHYLLLNSWTRKHQRDQWLSPEFQATWQGETAVRTYYDDSLAEFSSCSTTEAYLHLHTRINLEGLLERVDASTMAASVEARVPFTDHQLVEWAFHLPSDWKIRLNPKAETKLSTVFDWYPNNQIESKRILREAFAQRVPQSILERRKFSFPTPFEQSMRNEWSNEVRTTLQQSQLLRDILKDSPEKLADAGISTWLWLNLAIWAEQWQIEAS